MWGFINGDNGQLVDFALSKRYFRLMRKLCAFVFAFASLQLCAQCDDYQNAMYDAESYADDAYRYSKKAYYSDNLDDAQYYARKAKRSAEDAVSSASYAESYASDCGCDDGESSAYEAQSTADDAYRYAKKAYNSDNLDDAQHYANKAKRSADDARSSASYGAGECD